MARPDWRTVVLVTAAACARTGQEPGTSPEAALCSPAWCRSIEERVPTGDGQGHGPDLCSDEWKSAIEFRLGIRGAPGLPDRSSEDWCRRIDQLVREGASRR